MLNERDKSVLEHILEYCNKIERAIARLGITLEVLKTDEDYRSAISMYVLQIGELTVHLSKKFKETYTEMPWVKIKAMRNIVAHSYEKFNVETLYKTITNNIPTLKAYCQKLLNGNQ